MNANRFFAMAGVTLLAVILSLRLLAAANSSPETTNSAIPQGPSSNSSQAADRDASTARAIEASFGPTRRIEVTDPFYNNIVAYTIIVPKDWFFEGTILHGPGCNGLEYQSFVYRAYSPDAAFGVQSLPRQTFFYWEDSLARAEGPACRFFAPLSAADYASMFTYRMRPNAQIDLSEPLPDADQKYQEIEKANDGFVEEARRYNVPPEQDNGDFARTRIHYEWEGLSEEELLVVGVIYKDIQKSVLGPPRGYHPGTVGWHHYLQVNATMAAVRAPRGKLDQSQDALTAIAKSIRFNPEFQQATSAHQWDQIRRNVAQMWRVTNSIVNYSRAQMQLTQQNQQAFMNAMTQQHQQFMDNMQRQGEIRHRNAMAQINANSAQARNFMSQMDARTAHTRDYQDYLLNQQYYVNPQTGETATVSGRLTHTWANGPMNSNGTSIVQSPNPNYNPNGGMPGNWMELIPIHH
jgi:hypothetical protein